MMGRPASSETLFPDLARFPTTRYQGSKRKLSAAILSHLGDLEYETVLDAFSGSCAMAHAFKLAGKSVTCNDILAFNQQIGVALIENDAVRLDDATIDRIAKRHEGVTYGNFIERTFDDIYFTTQENRWLDVATENIRRIEDRFARAIAWFALFQAAMAKRPYNLFHRRNLYMRTAEVKRGFGNKTSWDRPFEDHFRRFAAEANDSIFDSGGRCSSLSQDAILIEPIFDLVYVDPPYINQRGCGVDYHSFYHFLEGMVKPDDWSESIDYRSRHRRLLRRHCPWSDPKTCHAAFQQLLKRFSDHLLVISYRSDGIPTVDELVSMTRTVARSVRVIELDRYQYALSTSRATKEILLIANG